MYSPQTPFFSLRKYVVTVVFRYLAYYIVSICLYINST